MIPPKQSRPLVYAAIDTADLDHAHHLVSETIPHFGGVKLGLEFFLKFGHQGIRNVMDRAILDTAENASLFLDLKLHDIPNTVAGGLKSIQGLNADFVTVHAAGGYDMIARAVECVKDTQTDILAVTVLTSMSQKDLDSFSTMSLQDTVLRMTETVVRAGGTGLVCSPHEVAILRQEFGDDITLMVPGIRPKGAMNNDQKRTMIPTDALTAGASHLVIGRAVTTANCPSTAAKDIMTKIHTFKRAA